MLSYPSRIRTKIKYKEFMRYGLLYNDFSIRFPFPKLKNKILLNPTPSKDYKDI